MLPLPDPISRGALCFAELLGAWGLANVDAAQRMHFLVVRLALGGFGSHLRTQMLRSDDVIYVADRAELEGRMRLIVEAGAEGCANIVRNYLEDLAGAQAQFLQGLFGSTPSTPTACLAAPAGRATSAFAMGPRWGRQPLWR